VKLGEILNNISYLRLEGKTDRPIDLISSDSRFLSSQTLFIVKEGHDFSGIDFIKDVKPHAVAFIAEGKHWRRLKHKQRFTLSFFSNSFYCERGAQFFRY